MIRRVVLALATTVVLSLGVQGGAESASSAQVASSRLVIPKTDTNAVIRKAPVIDGRLKIGHELQGVVWTPEGGDPPCDATGRTMYAGHAWRAGNGTADRWVTLKKGDIIKVAGCTFKVYKREKWSDQRPIGSLSKVDGRAEAALYACWASDYDYAVVIFAEKVEDKAES